MNRLALCGPSVWRDQVFSRGHTLSGLQHLKPRIIINSNNNNNNNSSGTTENSYFRHCTHLTESAGVEERENWCKKERDRHQRMYRQISCNSMSPRDRVCRGNISVNTLHKGENVNK